MLRNVFWIAVLLPCKTRPAAGNRCRATGYVHASKPPRGRPSNVNYSVRICLRFTSVANWKYDRAMVGPLSEMVKLARLVPGVGLSGARVCGRRTGTIARLPAGT
jgi:hypothetical protein